MKRLFSHWTRSALEVAFLALATTAGASTATDPLPCWNDGGTKSATIEFMWPWTETVYGVPPDQVVGSSI